MRDKVLKLLEKFKAVEEALVDPKVLDDKKKYKELTTEHSYLSSIKDAFEKLQSVESDLKEQEEMLSSETDEQLVSYLKSEIQELKKQHPILKKKLETLLVPPDPNDHRNIIMELRAGTGGDEAAIFVGDCYRMYRLFAEKHGWSIEILSCSESEAGGYKELIMVVSGQNVHRLMQYEAGTHRVQRVPVTETQGRVHTSAITVAVLLEPSEAEQVKLDEKDLRIDTYRASGAGGQHVNTTDSAVRITHIPTGTVAYCQEERSQHKNKDKALRFLQAKIVEAKRLKEESERSSLRSSQVGSGDRSERIRTYNFPQNRVTDHRIDLTLYKLDQVIQGELDDIIELLVSHFHQQKLSS